MLAVLSLPIQDAPVDELPGILNPGIVRKIDCALRRVGPYGEVRLIVVKGKVRFIEVLQSEEIRGE